LPFLNLTDALLGVTSLIGGAMNSVAGGGTLLTFPALLAVVTPVVANGTSTFALVPAGIGSAWAYRNELRSVSSMLKLLWLPSFLGGLTGSLAVTRYPNQFESMIPWLLLGATLLLLSQRHIAGWIGAHPHIDPATGRSAAPTLRTTIGVTIFQYFVGVYGGYFGAGIGILMLSSLELMGIHDIHELNALKVVLAFFMNSITLFVFIVEGVINWHFGILMAVCSVVGGYAGARLARRAPKALIRGIVVAVGFGLSAYSFYRRFAS
jgi:uncharacterized membrane protein YfcA